MMARLAPLVAAVVCVLPALAARADPENPYARSSPPGAPVSIGAPPYLTSSGSGGGTSSGEAVSDHDHDRDVTHEESTVVRARELLGRARFLDEAATASEKEAGYADKRLPALRAAAKAARDRADHAKDTEKDALVAHAEDLEADVAVTEAEVAMMRREAAEDRRVARDFRARAVKLVRAPPAPAPEPLASACDPPFRFTADGRKIYRIECLK